MPPNSLPTRDEIAKSLGVESLPPQAQEEAIIAAVQLMLQVSTLAILEKLPAEAQAESAKLAEAGDYAGIKILVAPHIANPDALAKHAMEQELAAYKEALARNLAK